MMHEVMLVHDICEGSTVLLWVDTIGSKAILLLQILVIACKELLCLWNQILLARPLLAPGANCC
jgi:hypothetical protein